MRIDANEDLARRHYRVWHCPTCKFLTDVFWVDDVTAQFGTGSPWRGTTHQAKRIQILDDRALILIDPLDDVDAPANVERTDLAKPSLADEWEGSPHADIH